MNIKEAIISSKGPTTKGPYSPALKVCEQVYISGQLPIDPATNKTVDGDIKVQTRRALDNMKLVLEEAGLDMKYVVKTTVFLTDINDFADMNEVYKEYFEEPYPARSACEVNHLVGDAKVEIEAIALDYRALEILCEGECECDGHSCSCE